MTKRILGLTLSVLCIFCFIGCVSSSSALKAKALEKIKGDDSYYLTESDMGLKGENDFIKWVDLNVSYEMLKKVYEYDVKYHSTDIEFKFIEVLAYLAVKNGNKFNSRTDNKNLSALVKILEKKETTVEKLYGENKYYKYYVNAFTAIFAGLIGNYRNENDETGAVHYGLKAYFPLAKGYWYNHYDDFGSKRSYGFKRIHLGHDMMGSVGTPIVAVEGGTVTELGWNRYGGWRVGIRSFDKKRYYYYAHLRKGCPFPAGLKAGEEVAAGQVIGFLGMTGYSNKEDTNLKTNKPHLHWGLQLIFDESQMDGSDEIWIDVYALTQFLSAYKAATIKDPETKEVKSVNLKRTA